MKSFQGINTGSTPTSLDCAAQYANLTSFKNFDSQKSVGTIGKNPVSGKSLELINLPKVANDYGLGNVKSLPGSLLVQGTTKLPELTLPVTSIGTDNNGRCLEIVNVRNMLNVGLRKLLNCEGGLAVSPRRRARVRGRACIEKARLREALRRGAARRSRL